LKRKAFLFWRINQALFRRSAKAARLAQVVSIQAVAVEKDGGDAALFILLIGKILSIRTWGNLPMYPNQLSAKESDTTGMNITSGTARRVQRAWGHLLPSQ
jgi:hypothetical protein